jgi:exosome complex RNA-binding protein Rrp42 (RNase PH superfamily)
VPKVSLFEGDGGQIEDFDVSGDLADSDYVDVRAVPLLFTACKIGDVYILDCNQDEQRAANAAISVWLDQSLACCGITKSLGGFTEAEDTQRAIEVNCLVIHI